MSVINRILAINELVSRWNAARPAEEVRSELDRTGLPIPEPRRATYTELDVRNASRPLIGAICCVLATLAASPASAQDQGAAALAKAAQTLIADMISLPFQSTTNFDVGPLNKMQEILHIQPVYPINLNAEWNRITRTIVPVISQPASTSSQDREVGIGDIQFSAFRSPKEATGAWVWGAGGIAQLHTATDDRPGQGA